MQTRTFPLNAIVRLILFLAILVTGFYPEKVAQAQSGEPEGNVPTRTQTIELEAGWNAVYLEVEPLATEPSALFAGTPIEIAAAYFRPVTSMQFIDSPNELLADRKGWSVWYAPERDDVLLTDLYAIQANNAYLVYTPTSYTWHLQGTSYFGHAQWHPNAYSLTLLEKQF